ncbi:hypothetical protein HX004_10045 [Myroides sp. 1354]|uniref:DUF6929 family protein n=1 Tax=unclassified Myroides TaxID=2642485 RepID=UPI0025785D4E|nr:MULTISPECIES: hypothetical protein [unclassified Myroides]MDM1045230.1 hypothetical protein [Myroides sp. R163-1]MDM1056112.1 hypothetical protein [Myroides sp. 1354]MDM1069241.1 hypothetical protein [Myroides sp. 1372]
MRKLTLEFLYHIIGLSAASGLYYAEDKLHLIADDSSYLYHYDIPSKQLNKTALTEDYIGQENIAKAEKPDLESMTFDGINYYLFGSGSKPNRSSLYEIHKMTNEPVSKQSLELLYESMKAFAHLDDADFNIEGVVYDSETWYFFNRGNGPKQQNGVFVVTGESILDNFRITYTPFKLPKLENVQTGFTDAVLVDKDLYFIATAEDSGSTYADGEIKGSIIGRINTKKMKLDKTKTISADQKFEGITVYKNSKKEVSFFLCTDPDNPELPTSIYQLTIQK